MTVFAVSDMITACLADEAVRIHLKVFDTVICKQAKFTEQLFAAGLFHMISPCDILTTVQYSCTYQRLY